MTGWLDGLLAPPRARPRLRPAELTYGSEDRVPLPVLLGLGAQHALLALIFALYAVIAGQSIGLDARQTVAYVSATVLVMGLGTMLQAAVSRFGAGMLLVTIPGAGRLAIYTAVTLQYGLAATMGATLVAGLLAIGMARYIPRLRAVFPPEVIGVVLLMMGITLVSGGMARSVGLVGSAGAVTVSGAAGAGALQPEAMLAALATVACLAGIAIWGSARLRRVAMLAAAVSGTLVAALAGTLPDAGALLAMPPLAVPVLGLALPVPEFHPVPILVMAVAQFISIMDQFGSTLSMDRMTDARWRRADMPLVARSITGMGLTHLLFGLTGTLAGAAATATIGLAHATGVAARRVGLAAGAMLVLAACVPPLAGLLVLTPAPVVGGILLYTAAYMISTGIDLIMSRMMNPRRSLTVGLAIVLGTAVMLLPEIARQAPAWLQVILQSGLTVGAVAAVALNALFRIGVRRSLRQPLGAQAPAADGGPPLGEAQQAAELLEASGRLWGVRPETVMRAGHAVGEALEALRAAEITAPVTLSTSFDEFSLVCRISYRGPALPLRDGGTPDAAVLLAAEDTALEEGLRRLSARLILRLADQARSAQKGAEAELVLVFSH